MNLKRARVFDSATYAVWSARSPLFMRLPPVNACYPPVLLEQICKFWAKFHRFRLRFQYLPVFVPCYCPISGCEYHLRPPAPNQWVSLFLLLCCPTRGAVLARNKDRVKAESLNRACRAPHPSATADGIDIARN